MAREMFDRTVSGQPPGDDDGRALRVVRLRARAAEHWFLEWQEPGEGPSGFFRRMRRKAARVCVSERPRCRGCVLVSCE